MQPTDSTFNVPPFPAFPSVARYVPLGSIDEALQRVSRSIDAREAISLVIGPPGTGKTLLCGLISERFRETHDVVVLGETAINEPDALMRQMLLRLGIEIEQFATDSPQLALTEYVCSPQCKAGGLIVVVDEAQSLGAELIETIRLITNITNMGQPRVSAVLCGNNKLEEKLISPSLESFNQRVATRCYLHALNGKETGQYITETIRACGAEPDDAVNAEAIAAVYHACQGIPRLVNQLMTEAIDCAGETEQEMISAETIDRAWAQLQQLPSPVTEEPKLESPAAVGEMTIEFGELEDLPSMGSTAEAEPDLIHNDIITSDGVEIETESIELDESETAIAESLVRDTSGLVDELASEFELVSEIIDTDLPLDAPSLVIEELSPRDYVNEEFDDEELFATPQVISNFFDEDIDGQSGQFESQLQAQEVDFDIEDPAQLTGGIVTSREFDPAYLEVATQIAAENENASRCLSPESLFGEFDDEEELDIGAGQVTTESIEVEDVTNVEDVTKAEDLSDDESSVDDIESVLHEEIIGIATEASNALGVYEHQTEISAEAHPAESFTAIVDDIVIEDSADLVAEDQDATNEPAGYIEQQPIGVDRDEQSTMVKIADLDDDIHASDDCDILVIEDELELRIDSRKQKPSTREHAIAVDFQAMLARMRSGA